MTAEVDGLVIYRISFDGPQLFAAQWSPGGVDGKAERLGRKVLSVLVHQSDLPRRRLYVVVERRRGTPGRHLSVHRHPVQHDATQFDDDEDDEFERLQMWTKSVKLKRLQ